MVRDILTQMDVLILIVLKWLAVACRNKKGTCLSHASQTKRFARLILDVAKVHMITAMIPLQNNHEIQRSNELIFLGLAILKLILV